MITATRQVIMHKPRSGMVLPVYSSNLLFDINYLYEHYYKIIMSYKLQFFFYIYLELKLYKSFGMYPSGDTDSVGGGNHITVKPREDNSVAFSLSSMYHLPDL